MSKFIFFLLTTILLIGSAPVAYAFNSGSTGADGAFNPTADTMVQLPDSGIMNYTTVNIPAGVTVTFAKNASNTPVYILAGGDITIAGTINISGANGNGLYAGRGGPGGYDGGLGGTINLPGGKGLGPGGGNSHSNLGGGGGGGFSSCTAGSGGGGGGGGAILIASSGTITITGSITAKGGNGASIPNNDRCGGGGGGSGGSIKVIASTISGTGSLTATGGSGGSAFCSEGGAGSTGRIRLEANTVTGTIGSNTNPPYTFGYPSTVFVANIPSLSIMSVNGASAPANPAGTYGSPDITLPATTTNPVTVEVSAANIPAGTTVTITSVPEFGSSTSVSAILNGTDASSTASAQLTLSTQYQCIMTATATFTIQTAMYYDGEKIEKVKVAAAMGKESETVYITESGKEIKAELIAKK